MTFINQENPLTQAAWLWPEGYSYLQNCYAQFRHDFKLNNIPNHAPFYITADQSYRLYVNGNYVCRGPARGYQNHWPYDEVDLHEYLQIGHNFLAVEAHNPGIGTFQYLHQNVAGFICAADWGDVHIRSNRASWQMRRAPGNNPHVSRLSVQLGWQEDYDASRDDGTWITSSEMPEWSASNDVRSQYDAELTYGKLPWNSLEERGIPLLRESLIVPQAITAHGVGAVQNGYRETENPSWHWNGAEHASVTDWKQHVQYTIQSDGLDVLVEPLDPGMFRAITIDFGKIIIGSFCLDIENCTGSEIIDCHYHQWLKDDTPEHLIPKGNAGQLALATRLRTKSGSCRRLFYPTLGARLVTLVCRDITKPINVKASWISAEYPFEMRGRFETSDECLNQIYDLCKHTQQICSTDAYIDTPWREQGQWWADARIQAKNTFYLDGDSRLLARGVRSIAGQPTTNGLTYGVAPCCSWNCVLPDFSLVWIMTVYDHYFQTGSLELFHEQKQRINGVLNYFASNQSANKETLLTYDPKLWLFEDWAALPKTGYPTYLNLWYLYALECYHKLLCAAGEEEESRSLASQINALRLRICDFFFDQDLGLFHSGRTVNNEPIGTSSVHDQTLAILLNLKPEFHETMMQKRLLPFLNGDAVDGATPTAYWSSFVIDAAQQLGYRRQALGFIRRQWAKMIPYGGTWEHLVFKEDEGFSCSHGWSAHPAFHLIELLWGLKQTSPAWKTYEYSPDFDLLPERGKIIVPLPQGDLELRWENKHYDVTLHERQT